MAKRRSGLPGSWQTMWAARAHLVGGNGHCGAHATACPSYSDSHVKPMPRDLGECCDRFNRRFGLTTMLLRLSEGAARTANATSPPENG